METNNITNATEAAERQLGGLHHITAVTGDAAGNVAFYTQVLGMRLVKKTVNQDDVSAYHLFYGDEAAQAAEHAFVNVFQQHALPDEMEEVQILQPMTLTDLLIFTQAAKSKNEARRLIDQGGVKLDGEAIPGATTMVEVTAPRVLQVGKRKFVRLVP